MCLDADRRNHPAKYVISTNELMPRYRTDVQRDETGTDLGKECVRKAESPVDMHCGIAAADKDEKAG